VGDGEDGVNYSVEMEVPSEVVAAAAHSGVVFLGKGTEGVNRVKKVPRFGNSISQSGETPICVLKSICKPAGESILLMTHFLELRSEFYVNAE
jgi:hypothetical protein